MSEGLSELFGLTSASLDACAREPIHIPGSIQPQGVLLVLRPDDLAPVQVSMNSSALLGVEPDQVLGRPLDELLGTAACVEVANALKSLPTAVVFSLLLSVSVRGVLLELLGLVHTYGGVVILELMPEVDEPLVYAGSCHTTTMLDVAQDDPAQDITLTNRFAPWTVDLAIDLPMSDFCQQVAAHVRALTGYDRVMVYQFDSVGNGTVIAEACDTTVESLLGLCYPASDIPPQARLLYLRSRVRALADIYYGPVPLVPRRNPLDDSDTDLSYTLLRSFSPVHLEYLHNMGVRATLTVSIIEQGRLWGLIACHHYQRKWPAHSMRLACDLLSELISMQVMMRAHYLQVQSLARAQKVQHTILRHMAGYNDWMAALEDPVLDLRSLVGADGLAICRGDSISTQGLAPDITTIGQILLWLQTTVSARVLVTDALGTLNPSFAAAAAYSSGLIAMEIARPERCYVLWFRREAVQTIRWGGNPAEKQLGVKADEPLRPRSSFGAWATEMRGHAMPWPSDAQYLTEALRAVLVEIVLELLTLRHTMLSQDLQRIRRAVEATSEPIAISDSQGAPLFVNQAFTQLTGYSYAELIGCGGPVALVVDRAIGALLEQAQLPSGGWRGEVDLYSQSGEVIPALLRVDSIEAAAGAVLGRIWLLTDLRMRRRQEQEQRQLDEHMFHLQKLESLGVLAGGIAHDFNNLLTAMLGHANLAMLDLPPGAPAREHIVQIELAAQRAADLSRQMLAYSGRGLVVVQSIDLNELVRELADLLQTAVSKKAEIRFELAPTLLPLTVDATQIRQVVMNLITNASDALNDQPGTITLRTTQLWLNEPTRRGGVSGLPLAPGAYVQLEVSDTGIGIDTLTLKRIFEPFFTTKFTGRGLGLAAVQGIVRSHNGAIEIASVPGQGTTFRIILPAENASLSQPAPPSRMSIVGAGQTALVIDDEPGVRDFTRRILERSGFRVLLAEDGLVGLTVCSQADLQIDVVLLDLTMPKMNGGDVFAALRDLRPKLPVILCSGYSREELAVRFADHPPAGFLQKPFRVIELLEVLRSVLGD